MVPEIQEEGERMKKLTWSCVSHIVRESDCMIVLVIRDAESGLIRSVIGHYSENGVAHEIERLSRSHIWGTDIIVESMHFDSSIGVLNAEILLIDKMDWCGDVSLNMRCAMSDDLISRIEAVPVRKGRWKSDEEEGCIMCSCCGDWWASGFETAFHYCPNCGAKMEGAEE